MRKSNIIDLRSRSAYVYKSDSYSLRDCLSCCSREDLEDIAMYQGMELSEGMKREALINLLEPQIIADFRRLVYYFLPEDIELLDDAVARRPIAMEDMIARDLYIYDLGFLYFFNEDKYVHPVLPTELQEILEEALKGDLLEQLPFREELANYVEVLLQFYGVFEVDQLVKVWNAYHRRSIKWEEAWDQLAGMEDVLACYWCDEGGLIVSDYFTDYRDVDRFMGMVENFPYYMPEKKEMDRWPMGGRAPSDAVRYRAIERFLETAKEQDPEAPWDEAIVLQDVSDAALFFVDPGTLLRELESADEFTLEGEAEREFLKLYEEYRNHAVCWALRGERYCNMPETVQQLMSMLFTPEEAPKKPALFTIKGGKE